MCTHVHECRCTCVEVTGQPSNICPVFPLEALKWPFRYFVTCHQPWTFPSLCLLPVTHYQQGVLGSQMLSLAFMWVDPGDVTLGCQGHRASAFTYGSVSPAWHFTSSASSYILHFFNILVSLALQNQMPRIIRTLG